MSDPMGGSLSDDVFARALSAPYVRRAGCFAAAAIVLCAAAVSAAPTTVTFSAPRPILRIENLKPDGIGEIVIEASIAKGEGEIPKTPPLVSDDGPQDPPPAPATPPAAGATPAPVPTVTFSDTIETAASTATRRQWRVRASLRHFPTTGTTMPRKLKISWGSFGTPPPLLYWASNVAPPAMTWKVTGLPAEWSARESWCIPLRIAVTGPRATGILLTSTLVEQTTKKTMASGLSLVVGKDQTDAAKLEEAVNSQQQIKLCGDAADASPGKYQGQLNVSAAEKPEGDPVTVTLSVTTWKMMWIGIGVLLLGCVFAYVLRVIAPARLLRSQALLPATLIRDRAIALLDTLDDALRELPAETARLTKLALQKLITDLGEESLEKQGLIPRRIPSPLGASVDAAKYKSLLDDSSAKLARLDVLVNEGFVPAVGIGTGHANLPGVLTALDGFMNIDPPPALGALRTMIAAEIAKLTAGLAGDAIQRPQVTTETLTFQIEQTSILLWVGSLLLSFTIGLFVLILNNPAFGVPIDYLYCFLWGFGIPAVAGQLTPTAANTALGITLPKTTG